MLGKTLLHYEVTDRIGAGGMGEVYRATDTKLGRDVAIKVLPSEVAGSEERLSRFRREARVLAALNHSNIAAIYGLEESDGTPFLVMELVEGEDLEERLKRGRMPLDEALEVARQIAVALEEAHEKGIIHRDLKPANIKLTPDGRIKVLDFGLARALEEDRDSATGSSSDLSQSPTLVHAGTQAGVILGTAAYMSPEQAQGRPVDERTDIWAFGVVLYEMLTGISPFKGDDLSLTLASVLKSEPDLESLPQRAPGIVRTIVARCLQKDPRQRMRDMGDVRLALSGAFDADAIPDAARFHRGSLAVGFGGAAIVGATVALVVAWQPAAHPPTAGPDAVRLQIAVPPTLRLNGNGASFALAPDGSKVVFSAIVDGRTQLYLRELDRFESTPIAGTEAGVSPFFAPDGERIGFFALGQIRVVPLEGGVPTTVCDAPAVTPSASWGTDGTILFAARGSQVWRVPARGGEPEPLTTLSRERGETAHGSPRRLPDGALMFEVITGAGSHIAVIPPGEKEPKLVTDGLGARYLATGHLAYVASDRLAVAPYSLERHELNGRPMPVVDGIEVGPAAKAPQFDVSESGTLAYVPSGLVSQDVVSVTLEGEATPLMDASGRYSFPRLSPDGRRLAVVQTEAPGKDADLWLNDIARGSRRRLTREGTNISPAWAPSGAEIAFASSRRGAMQSYRQPLEVDAAAVPILKESSTVNFPVSWSPDGRTLALVYVGRDRNFDVHLIDLETGADVGSLTAPFNERSPTFSPDGRWLLYTSDESGRYEVYARDLPALDRQVSVSTGGGREPIWPPSAGRLFYRNGAEVWAVDVETEPTFTASRPRLLFEGDYEAIGANASAAYDFSSDGRFVMLRGKLATGGERIHVVLHWTDEVARAGDKH